MNSRATHPERRRAAAPGPFVVERTLKQDARSTVELIRLGERRAVRKQYHVHPLKRAAYRPIGRLPAQREAANARRLADLGIRVPQPVEVIGQAVVMPYVAGPSLHEFVGGCDDAAKRQTAARAVGEQMRRIIDAGLVNRDHKARNLIIDTACAERGAQPVLIDPAGLRRATPRRIARMAARLIETARKAGPLSRREMLRCYHSARTAPVPGDVRRVWLDQLNAELQRMGADPL